MVTPTTIPAQQVPGSRAVSGAELEMISPVAEETTCLIFRM